MSISAIVDQEYRLDVDDLNRQTHQVVISNVSYQGIEELHPVLHFEGFTKRLILSPAHVRTLILATNTAVFEEWIGNTVLLRPHHTADTKYIEIVPVRRRFFTRRLPRKKLPPETWNWLLAIVLVICLALLSLYYIQTNLEHFQSLLEQLSP